MPVRIHAFRRVARSLLACAALAVLPFLAGCAHESLSVNFTANPTDKSGQSTVPFIGQVRKDKQNFYFVLKSRRVIENGVPVEKPYHAGISASKARAYLPGVISALIMGQLGAAQTTTVKAYADGTTFAIVTDPDGTTYVVHIDHTERESVVVSLLRNGATQKITANGFVVVHPKDLTIAAYTPITDNTTLAPLPGPIADEIRALKKIAAEANVP